MGRELSEIEQLAAAVVAEAPDKCGPKCTVTPVPCELIECLRHELYETGVGTEGVVSPLDSPPCNTCTVHPTTWRAYCLQAATIAVMVTIVASPHSVAHWWGHLKSNMAERLYQR